jgi:hypothetical protein
MANYTGQSCIDEVVVILTGSTGFTTGQIVGGFPIGSGPGATQCYTILGNASLSETPTIQIQGMGFYGNCIECYEEKDLGFEFEDCITGNLEVVTAFSLGFVPTIDLIYQFSLDGSAPRCYIATGNVDPNGVDISPQSINVFTRCEDCYKNQTVTAGTEYTVCVICCPCDSGSTVTSVAVPHPVWTSTDGKAVVQSNMVVLGGPNGLNN